MEDVYTNVKGLTVPLEQQLDTAANTELVQGKLGHLLRNIDRVEPLRPLPLLRGQEHRHQHDHVLPLPQLILSKILNSFIVSKTLN